MGDQFFSKQDDEYTCGVCNRTIRTYGGFKSHFIQAHPDKIVDGEVPWNESPYRAGTVTLECEECGQEYERNASNADSSRFCSEDCMFNYADRTNAYETEWKAEVTWDREHRGEDVNRGVYWNTQKELALSRDEHICHDCEFENNPSYVHGIELEVHHIIPARLFENPDYAHSLVNLIVLCSRCHGKWEREFRLIEDGDGPENHSGNNDGTPK